MMLQHKYLNRVYPFTCVWPRLIILNVPGQGLSIYRCLARRVSHSKLSHNRCLVKVYPTTGSWSRFIRLQVSGQGLSHYRCLARFIIVLVSSQGLSCCRCLFRVYPTTCVWSFIPPLGLPGHYKYLVGVYPTIVDLSGLILLQVSCHILFFYRCLNRVYPTTTGVWSRFSNCRCLVGFLPTTSAWSGLILPQVSVQGQVYPIITRCLDRVCSATCV